jgi:hypothetical protein
VTKTFLEELREQRWDDHRFYHRHRVNQSLHLVSALCFLTTYVLIPISPITAAIFGWVIAMWPRQIGHFWFEPRGYDEINNVTFEHKEEVKVGFNLRRKVILFSTWAAIPVVLYLRPDFFGLASPSNGYWHELGFLWLYLAGAGLVARSLYLCVTRGPVVGAAWFTKILTDPFHDILLYWKAPLHLVRGDWLDPMDHVSERTAG